MAPNGRVAKVQHEGEEVDPLYELLVPPQLRPRGKGKKLSSLL